MHAQSDIRFFFFSSRRRHTRLQGDWSSDVCSSDLLGEFAITDELTEFTLADDARAWWIPSNRPRLDRSEMLFSCSPVSVLDSVQTPLTLETRDGRTFIVIHEANLVDYARMFLSGPRMQSRTLRAALAPYADGIKVRGRTPFVTPWRTIQLEIGRAHV